MLNAAPADALAVADVPNQAPVVSAPALCTNCSAALAQTRPNFCPVCGQETNIKPPLMCEFLQQFGGAYFSTEGAFWRTLKLLLTRPGELTVQYLAGRRKHYVLPLRLYLTLALLMAAVVRFAGVSVEQVDAGIKAARPDDRPKHISIDLGFGRAGVKAGVFYCEGLPTWLCQRAKVRMDVDNRGLIERLHTVLDRVVNNIGVIMFVLLPAFAFGLLLVYHNRHLRYTEHLVFALHLHAFGALVLAVMAVELPWVNWLGAIVLPAYAALAMKRVYGGRWWVLLLRLWALTTAHAVVATAVALVATLVALLA
jgi:Protein of unknown function (DUF3667)